ncbi:hypothetical protein GCM10022393_11100 [Aquimarina addita]|uniref:Signal transduction histidine kinase internal region domain-containing protein n=2 Tax=Aquimarina addita TaxID=870485 RepID=A0ABP7XDE8_9FLAO
MIHYIIASIIFLIAINYLVSEIPIKSPFREALDSIRFKNDFNRVQDLKNMVRGIFFFAFFLLGGIFCLIFDFYKRDKISSETEVQRTETELQFLKAQLNPHFLFNSLNSVYSLVRTKSDDAAEAVLTLSELMRYMLYEANQKMVPLLKEIDYIKNYVSLQRLRLSNSEDVTLSIKGEYEHKSMYPLLLISFIENAFKYGTDYKGVTDIQIKIKVEGDILMFTVSNIIGIYKKNIDNSGVGLTNIRKRLELLYPNLHMLTIKEGRERYVVDLTLTLT